MPTNKSAIIRYRAINRYLIDKEKATLQQLKEYCERVLDIYPIGKRTIEGDISAMKNDGRLGYYAPIEYDRNSKSYYYSEDGYSIDNIPLQDEELNSIVVASRLLDQYRDVEIFKTFSGSVKKLVNAAELRLDSADDSYMNLISFEKVGETEGSEFIQPLMNALKNKSVVSLEYKAFNSEKSKSHIIHPYHLREYRNRWYLVGYHNKYKAIRTYALDRIVKFSIENGIGFIDNGFKADEYYADVIGVSVIDKKPVEIHVAFSHFQAQYVLTQPLHRTQEMVSESEEKIIFSYKLIPNFEFISQILGWGDEVEVLKPVSIRNQLKDLIDRIGGKY